jgi:P27 family predicted phage terminase small subunit
MAGQRQPIELVVANGRKHLTKAETEERRQRELKPRTEEITAPSYLTAKQKKEFDKIANQLQKLNIMGETDVDALARYITAQGLYEQAVKDIRKLEKDRPKAEEKEDDPKSYYANMDLYYTMMDNATRRQDRYFKQAQQAANALGLTISARCRLVAPVVEEKPKENKFSKFGKAAGYK